MPTIRNDGTIGQMVEGVDGKMTSLQPGEIMVTYSKSAQSLPGITVISPAPYYNPAAASSFPASAGPGDDKEVALQARTASVEVINASQLATISLYIDSLDNLPCLNVVPQSRRIIDNLRDHASKLILQFSGAFAEGECIVTQLV